MKAIRQPAHPQPGKIHRFILRKNQTRWPSWRVTMKRKGRECMYAEASLSLSSQTLAAKFSPYRLSSHRKHLPILMGRWPFKVMVKKIVANCAVSLQWSPHVKNPPSAFQCLSLKYKLLAEIKRYLRIASNTQSQNKPQ